MNDLFLRLSQLADYYNIKKPIDFAKKTGFSHQTASNYLKGLRTPTIEALAIIQQSFDAINAEWLLTGKGLMISKNEIRITDSEPATEVLVKNLLDMIERKDKTIIEMAKEIGELHNEVSILKKQGKTTNHLYAAEP